ncbi:hypothetical protein DENSPDRAFT_855572 [Dentipellis sp. KUC8613]|nr:hypothetical protein DENSPDRAFT_855572 [Dentipellis sp. KUC8613]
MDASIPTVELIGSGLQPDYVEPIQRQRFLKRRYSYDDSGTLVMRSITFPSMGTPRSQTTDVFEETAPKKSVKFVDASASSATAGAADSAPSPTKDWTVNTITGLLQQATPSTYNPGIALALAGLAEDRDAAEKMLRDHVHSLTEDSAKQEKTVKPFGSSTGSGDTIWFTTSSQSSMAKPPKIDCKTADLYVHHNVAQDSYQIWMFSTVGQWEKAEHGDPHPFVKDRVLNLSDPDKPSWITHATALTNKSRKKRKVAK